MKKQADRKRQEKEFTVGEWVWVKLHRFKQGSLAKRLNFKLSKRYYGLFKIVERVGAVAYKLELPDDSKIHNVFHVALSKDYVGAPPSALGSTPTEVSFNLIEAQAIINKRRVNHAGSKVLQVLLEWTGMNRDEAA